MSLVPSVLCLSSVSMCIWDSEFQVVLLSFDGNFRSADRIDWLHCPHLREDAAERIIIFTNNAGARSKGVQCTKIWYNLAKNYFLDFSIFPGFNYRLLACHTPFRRIVMESFFCKSFSQRPMLRDGSYLYIFYASSVVRCICRSSSQLPAQACAQC